MHRLLVSLALPLLASISVAAAAQQPRVLVFSKTAGFPHSSIPNGIAAIRKLGQENGFAVDATEDAGAFTQKNLARYSAEGCTPRCEHTSQVVRQEEVCLKQILRYARVPRASLGMTDWGAVF